MNPQATIEMPSSVPYGQFRIRTLMFTTLVVALCGAIFQVSIGLGIALTVPLSVALVRALRTSDPQRGLLGLFSQSLALIAGLVVGVILNLASIVFLAAIGALYLIVVVGRGICRFFRDRLQRRRYLGFGSRCAYRLAEWSRQSLGWARRKLFEATGAVHRWNRKLVSAWSA